MARATVPVRLDTEAHDRLKMASLRLRKPMSDILTALIRTHVPAPTPDTLEYHHLKIALRTAERKE